MISIVVAVANNNVIGKANQLIWKLPADLKHFRKITEGHTVVMGRKTFESIGRPLPNRRNIVITRQADFAPAGVDVVHSLDEALQLAGAGPTSAKASAGAAEIFVIGGGEIFRQALPLARRIYFTRIDHEFDGDAFFPELDPKEWKEVSREEGIMDEKNIYPHAFLIYERSSNVL